MYGKQSPEMVVRVPLEPEATSELGAVLLILLAAAAGGALAGPLAAIAAGLMVLTLQLARGERRASTAVGRFVTREALFDGPGYVALSAFDRQTRRRCTLVLGRSDAGLQAPVRRSLSAGAYDEGATRDGRAFWALPG